MCKTIFNRCKCNTVYVILYPAKSILKQICYLFVILQLSAALRDGLMQTSSLVTYGILPFGDLCVAYFVPILAQEPDMRPF